MRLRSIFPSLWQSEPFAAVSWDARVMLIGLWSYADDAGRGLDRVALIAAALFPFDLERGSVETFQRVAAAVDELAAAGLIDRYEIGGTRYLQIVNWDDWQKPQRPTPSRFPPCSSGGFRSPPEDSPSEVGVRSTELGVRGAGVSEPSGVGWLDDEPRCDEHRNTPHPPPCRKCKRVREQREAEQQARQPTAYERKTAHNAAVFEALADPPDRPELEA